MSDWMNKAKDFIKGHPDQATEGLAKVEGLINEKTGGKYADQIQKGGDALQQKLGLPPHADDTIPAPEPPAVPTPPGQPSPPTPPEQPTPPGQPTPAEQPEPSDLPTPAEPPD